MIIKWLVCLHLSCLHIITFKGKKKEQFCIVHVFINGGKIFPEDFNPQNTFSKFLARIGSQAHAVAQREAGMQISGLFTLLGGRQEVNNERSG